MDQTLRNLKNVCSMLHQARNEGHELFDQTEIVSMIDTVESIYHGMKDNR